MYRKDKEALEDFIGKYCICDVIREIANICTEKSKRSAHDEELFDIWEENENILTLAHNDISCPNHRE